MWYNYNNGKHADMHKIRVPYFYYWYRRLTKHEAIARYMGATVFLPFLVWLNSQKKRFAALPKEEESLYSGAQYVATIGRNQYGFETRAAKSFEHGLSTVLGVEIFGHILSQDVDMFRAEELSDEDGGLTGDFSEEDILALRKEPNHAPHVGIVFFRPEMHYLNEKPNDFLSPYKVVGENIPKSSHGHEESHKGHH